MLFQFSTYTKIELYSRKLMCGKPQNVIQKLDRKISLYSSWVTSTKLLAEVVLLEKSNKSLNKVPGTSLKISETVRLDNTPHHDFKFPASLNVRHTNITIAAIMKNVSIFTMNNDNCNIFVTASKKLIKTHSIKYKLVKDALKSVVHSLKEVWRSKPNMSVGLLLAWVRKNSWLGCWC